MWSQTKLVLSAMVLIPIVDYVWIGLVMQRFYVAELGALARVQDGVFKPYLPAAAGVYFCLALGIVFFILSWVPDWTQALRWGALLGFIIYAVYDLTNLAILQNYSVKMSVVDIAWGAVLCGTTSALLFVLKQWIV